MNNPGVTRDMLSMAMSPEDWDVVLNRNLKGTFNFVQVVQQSIIKQRRGRIISISSVIGLRMRCPGYITTHSTSALSEEIQKSIRERIPLQRVGTPEDVAAAVAFARRPKQVTSPVKCFAWTAE